MHARTIIRKSVVSLLKNSRSLTKTIGEKIYESKVYPIDNTPSIVVYTPNEQVLESSIGFPRSQTRQLTMLIELYTKENGPIDQISDSLALEVEEILSSDPMLGNLVKDLALHSSETILSGEGDKPIAITTLTYHLTYRVKENSPHKLI